MDTRSHSPLIERHVKCQACGRSAPQRFFRTRMFIPEETEPDGHVVRYRWLRPNIEPVHPPLYFVMMCPHCFFADVAEDYSGELDSFRQRLVKKFQTMAERERVIVAYIARHIHYDELEFESSLNLHYLALLIQGIMGAERDVYKCGRLLLRIAWLFRENTPPGGGEPVYSQIPSMGKFLEKLGELWPQAPTTERAGMEAAVPFLRDAISTNERFADNHAYFRMVALVIELMVRVDQMNEAYQMVRSLYKRAADVRSRLQGILRDRRAEEADRTRAKAQLYRVSDALREAGELRQDLLARMIRRDRPVVEEVVREMEGADHESVVDAVRQRGVPEEVIHKVIEQGLVPAPKKKGLFF